MNRGGGPGCFFEGWLSLFPFRKRSDLSDNTSAHGPPEQQTQRRKDCAFRSNPHMKPKYIPHLQAPVNGSRCLISQPDDESKAQENQPARCRNLPSANSQGGKPEQRSAGSHSPQERQQRQHRRWIFQQRLSMAAAMMEKMRLAV